MATLTGPLNKSANTSGTTLVAKASTDTTYSGVVGDMFVLAFVCNLNTATATVADSAGNTWVQEDAPTAASNNRLIVFTCRLTSALATSGTITITCTSVSRRGSQLYKISGAGGFLARNKMVHATSTTTALSLQSFGSLGDADEYVFKFDGMTTAGAASGRVDATGGWTDKGTVESGGTVVSVALGSSFIAATNRSWAQFANTATQTAAVARASVSLSIRGISAPTDGYVQSFGPAGFAAASTTATPLQTPVTGNTLIAVAVTNENTAADDINTPAGWVPMAVVRNAAGTHVRLKVFGIHVADWIALGSPAMTFTSAQAGQRLQITVAEFSGEYTLTPEASGTNEGTSNTSGTTGSVTPLGTGRLVLMAFAEKNAQPVADAATPPVFSALTVTNEDPSVLSSNKLSVLVGYVTSRGASATSISTTWPTTNAAWAGISISLPVAAETTPTAAVLDNFNTGASQNLDGRSGWGVAGRVIAGDFSLKTDATPTVAGVSLGTPASNLWGTGFGVDHEVFATLGTADTFYLVARGNTATGVLSAGYLAVIGWTGQIDVRTYNGTVLYTSTPGVFTPPAAGDSYAFQAKGTTLTVWRRKSGGSWQALVTITDSTHTTGTFVGVKAESGTTATVADFGAKTLVVSSLVQLTFSSAGSGTTSFTLGAKRALAFTSAGSGTSSFALRARRALAITSAGSGTTSFALRAKRALALTSTGIGTTAFALTRKRPLTMDESAPTATGVLDDFNTGALQNLTSRAGWGAGPVWNSEPTLATNATPDAAIAPTLGAWRSNYWATSSADQEAWAEAAAPGAGAHNFDLMCRISNPNTSTPSYYSLEVNLLNGAWNLYKYVAGAATLIDSEAVATPHSAGEAWKLRVVGTTLTVWRRTGGVWVQQTMWNSGGTPLLSRADATHASGFPGFEVNFATSIKVNEFGGGALVGAGGGVGTTSFTLGKITAVIRPLAFTSTGTGTTTFALTARRALAFTSTGSGTSSFALRARRALAFTSTGVGTSSFTLAARRALAFTSTGAGTTTFTLRARRALSLSSTGTGTTSFTLTARRALAFSSTGAGTSAFALAARRALALSSTGTGTTTFALGKIGGAAPAKQLYFDERGATGLPGDPAGPSDPGYPGVFGGGIGTTSFTLGARRALTFTSTGTGTTSFTLTARRALALTSTGVGTSSFTLRARRALAFTSTGAGTSTFTLRARRALAFTSTGAGTTTFALRARRALAFTSTGVGTSTFAVGTIANPVRPIAFTSTGVGTTTFALRARRAMTFTSTGVGTSSFSLKARRGLAFTSTGVGTTTFSLRAWRALTFVSNGVGTTNLKHISVRRLLAFTSAGVGTTSFTLIAVAPAAAGQLVVIWSTAASLAVTLSTAAGLDAAWRAAADLDVLLTADPSLDADVSAGSNAAVSVH